MTKNVIWTALLCAGLAVGCGSVDDPITDSGATPDDDDGAEGSTSFNPGTGVDPSDTTPTTGMTSGASTGDDDGPGDSSGSVFIEDPDGGGVAFECDLFAQDCPEGEKCMPWANDGGTWNATRCSPIMENPGQPGDECTVEGNSATGIDSCDIAMQCWDVDPKTNTGVCVAMCTGDESNPICEDPDTTCSIANDGAIVLCLPVCDPIIQDCVDGQACYPIAEDWVCGPDASGEMGVYGDPCEFINVCDPGLICDIPEATPGCVGALGCCTEVCDLTDPAGNAQCQGEAQGQECIPWYPPEATPPGYEDVGTCTIPA